MKIHEQEWKQGGNPWHIRDVQTHALRAAIYTDNQSPHEADGAARLIAAAPKMARALLAVREACVARTDDESKALERAFDALRSAGVL